MRRVDLATNIIAPIATGQVLGFGSIISGAIFIASWNLVSVFVEYVLIKKVYDSVPALAKKKYTSGKEKGKPHGMEWFFLCLFVNKMSS